MYIFDFGACHAQAQHLNDLAARARMGELEAAAAAEREDESKARLALLLAQLDAQGGVAELDCNSAATSVSTYCNSAATSISRYPAYGI